jgi:hypothetical protein
LRNDPTPTDLANQCFSRVEERVRLSNFFTLLLRQILLIVKQHARGDQ